MSCGIMKSGSRVCCYTNGKGRWLRREWKPQCSEKVFIYGRCQGTRGHKGVHWCYGPCGSFQWSDNEDDRKHDGCAGSTPPGHRSYVQPAKMQKHYYLNFYTDNEVLDKKIVAMLEKDKTPERGAGINRPVAPSLAAKILARRSSSSLLQQE